jgi:hypothetical protein
MVLLDRLPSRPGSPSLPSRHTSSCQLRGERGNEARNSRGQQAQPGAPLDPRPPTAISDSIDDSGAHPDAAHGESPVISTVESHFTAENAAGASNWLLMFSTSWPSFSVLATTAAHSGSARKAFQRFSRSAMLSQASM